MTNANLELRVSNDAREIVLVDKKRGCAWRLDPRQRLADETALPDSVVEAGLIHRWPHHPDETVLLTGTVEPLPEGFRITHLLKAGQLVQRWTLADDHVRVELESAPATVSRLSLPGPFQPSEGKASLLLSVYQGVLYRPNGEHWSATHIPGGHAEFSMAMNALLGERGGLLVTQETVTDWDCTFGENELGPSVFFSEVICPVTGWYRREVRLYPVDANINAVAKRYRRRVQERGEFVSWEEKIARKPVVEKLFGALFAFTGYNHAPEVDYVAGAKKLNEMGFARVLYYPVRMAHYSLDFLMGGDKPIWLSDETLQRLHAVPGALIAPWGFYVEGLDDGTEEVRRLYRRKPDGAAYKGWVIEDQQWYLVCPGEQVEVSRQRFATDLREMDWIHYDVNTNWLGREVCFATDHPSHPGRPLTKTDDVNRTLQILGPDVNGNRIVSSEGFIDRYTTSYEIGSTKLLAACGRDVDFIPVPLTMLVFHDSTVHNWWETYGYNPVPGMHVQKNNFFGLVGSGAGPKMAAQDALYGSPPQVFPFGRQYAWMDIQSRRTFSFCIQLADREVQTALQAALPVAQLHRRIGKLEMLSFEFVTPDAAVQTTQFTDGTRIVANISDKVRETSYGKLAANSWKEVPV